MIQLYFALVLGIWKLNLAFLFLGYPHKYGPQGGCADHSVFERMQKYQMTGIEEPTTEVQHTLMDYVD